ncbi:MAG TPA: hypothetical protein VH583_03200 [Vicinamibacterales bacterium]|jgi:hypothetical protein
MTTVQHSTNEELDAGLAHIRSAPKDAGVLRMIVRRPDVNVRQVLDAGDLDAVQGLVGDTWHQRTSRKTPDGSPHPDMQINLMNSRVAALVAREESRWSLAGDQLFVDFDLSGANLPPGTRLSIGNAIIEVTDQPHTGCAKFVQRFGVEAAAFVNSPVGRELNLRGINARVVQSGRIEVGDAIRKLA